MIEKKYWASANSAGCIENEFAAKRRRSVRGGNGGCPLWGYQDLMKSTSVHLSRLSSPAVILIALGMFLACLSASAAPANDACAGRVMIPDDGPFPFHTNVNTFGATTLGDPSELPSCQASVAGSVWFEFRPEVTAFYTVSTCSEETTLEDTVMAIYTSDSGCVPTGFHELEMSADGLVNGCNDDACGPGQGLLAAITTRLDADTAYYIVVWRYDDGFVPSLENSKLQLIINRTFPPENDTCLTRTFLPLNVRVDGSTIGATNQYQNRYSTNGRGRDVVYSFTAPEATNYSFIVQNYRGEDLVIYAATNCPSSGGVTTLTNLLAVGDRNDVSTSEEIFCLPLAANQEISIYVDDHDPSSIGGTFSIQATKCVLESEPNNTNYWANPLVCGIEGRIFPARDKDFFALGTFPAGYRAFAMVDAAAAKFPEMVLRVVTVDNEVLEFDGGFFGNNDVPFGDLSGNVAGTPLVNKPTYLQVDMGTALTNEPYRIYAVVQPPYSAATPETESNDSTATANQDAANYFRGLISAAADVDTFGFFADSGDLIFVSLDADPLRNTTPFNARLELLDEAGNVLISVDDLNSDSQSGTNLAGTVPFSPGEALVYRSNDEALYFVRVSATPRAGEPQVGDYLLSITRNCSGQSSRADFRSINHLPDGRIVLQLQGSPNATYRIEGSGDLQNWTTIDSRTADSSGMFSFEDNTLPRPDLRFYRAVWP